MFHSFWSRVVDRASPTVSRATEMDMLEQAGKSRLAKNLRDLLRVQTKQPSFVSKQLPRMVEKLYAMSWPTLEVEKVQAYAEFFSGANARGYQRVMQQGLAKKDYTLFMTACVYCYLADRFTEGAALLDVFQPDDDPSTDWVEYWAFAGYIHFAAGRPIKDALAYFDHALASGGFSSLLAVNAYPIYFEAGRLEQCRIIRELIRTHCPDDPDATFALACVELAKGYYGEGFRLMESRFQMPELARSMNISLMQKPRWDNQSLAGKRLLIHGEQGIGDMIMMARYLPMLRELGAQLMIDGRAEVGSLLSHNFPYCKFIVGDIHRPISEPFDYWSGLMSLPYQFKTTALNVPAIHGFLTVPLEQADYWRPRVRTLAAGASFRIGLTWSGNPGHRADKRRSMSFELICSLVRRHPDVRFFSLQTHVPPNQLDNLIDVADELPTLADTAAVISEMDLVISVDTSAIHLAGGLGRPAWLLLPYRYEWRWGLEGETNPWYSSVKVLRQGQPGAWQELLGTVSKALQSFANSKTGT